jgi:hypothetical protein
VTRVIVHPPKKIVVTVTPPVPKLISVTAAPTGKPGLKGDKGDKGDAGGLLPDTIIDCGIIF